MGKNKKNIRNFNLKIEIFTALNNHSIIQRLSQCEKDFFRITTALGNLNTVCNVGQGHWIIVYTVRLALIAITVIEETTLNSGTFDIKVGARGVWNKGQGHKVMVYA